MGEIYRALEALGKYLGADPIAVGILLVLPLAAMYFRFKYHQDVLKSSRGLAGVRERLATHGDWRSAYFGGLRRVLGWVDCKLGASAWSADSYEFTLNMAFIYPFASLFIVWFATGQNTSGISALLPSDWPLPGRALLLSGVFVYLFFIYRSVTRPDWRNLVVCTGIFASIFAGTFAFAILCAFAYAGALSIAFSIAFVFAMAVATSDADAHRAAGGFLNSLIFATIVASIMDTMVRRGLNGISYVIFHSLMLGLLAVAISHPGWFRLSDGLVQFVFLFLLLLPLTNSVFDWLSLAATRGLLKGMAERDDIPSRQVARNALLGLILGLLLLAGLAVAVTAGLQTVNFLSQSHGGPEYIDLAGLLQRLRTNPADPAVWWVYFTLFSTMLPTVFHAAIASASFVTWRLPDSWKRHWLDDVIGTGDIKDDHPALVGMAWRLTLMDAVTALLAALSAAILAWLLFWLLPLEGIGLLWLCERVAEWLGAPIQI